MLRRDIVKYLIGGFLVGPLPTALGVSLATKKAALQEELGGFRLGDIVRLSCESPLGEYPMRVIGFSTNGRVWCEWQRPGFINIETAKTVVEEASFRPESLEKEPKMVASHD